MNLKWEIRRVSTPERIFDKIRKEMAQPVGIVLFGASRDFTNEVLDTIVEELRGSARYCTKLPNTVTIVKVVRNYPAIVFMLSPEESGMHDLRHELVKVMRNAGAKTVVGIYAKVNKKPIRALMSNVKDVELNKAITVVEQSNPTADGLDYFIVVEEEEG